MRNSTTSSTRSARSHEHISREEEADLTLRHTQVSRATAWMLSLSFCALIALPATIQHFAITKKKPSRDAIAFRSLLPSWQELRRVRGVRSALLLLPSARETKNYETQIERDSWLSQNTIPPFQAFATGVFGAGNERVYVARDKWLFLKAEIDYLTGKGFLDPKTLRRASKTEAKSEAKNPSKTAAKFTAKNRVEPDPLPAILDLGRQLKARGIALVVMPVPAKATIHPEQFAPAISNAMFGATSSTRNEYLQPENVSFARFTHQLRAHGITVYQSAPVLLRAKCLTREPQYLALDSHWTPQAMTRVARDLAHFVERRAVLSLAKRHYTLRAARETNICDLELMLKLPKNQRIFRRTTVKTQRVLDERGVPLKPQRDAEVLLLGDSFSNIYSHGGFWGRGAGLPEHLSFYLRRPVDKIAINGGGAAMNRLQWIQDLRGNRRDLRHVRVVILQFATRSLVNNNWKTLALPRASPTL